MSDEAPPSEVPDLEAKRRKKKADKARGAWMSFAGRVVAQIVGAVASVTLGVIVLQRYQQRVPGDTPPAVTTAPRPAAGAGPRRPGPSTIAVLPLANLSGDADQEALRRWHDRGRHGGADPGRRAARDLAHLRDALQDRPSVDSRDRARPRRRSARRGVGAPGRRWGTDPAQLIDGGTHQHLWAESYTRTLKDVLALQDAVATAIATAIKGTVSRRPGSRPATEHAVDPAAYDLYLRGRHAANLRTPVGFETAIAFYTQALTLDPAYALAHVGVAEAYALQGSPNAGPADARARIGQARASAIRALDLDGNLAEAHSALGGVLFFGDRDFRDGEMNFRRAIELNPSYAVAHEWLAILLAELGRDAEALEHVEIAVALNPLEATMYQARGMVHYYAKRFADAALSERRALELQPSLPLARSLLVKSLTLGGDARSALVVCDGGAPSADGDVALACVVAASRVGDRARTAAMRASLEAQRPLPEAVLAQIDAALEDHPAAFARLNRLAARGNLPPALAFDPLFEPLRRATEWPALAPALAAPSTRAR